MRAASLAGILILAPVCSGAITAVALPDPQVAGFSFPESEATIAGWVQDLENGPPDAAAAAFEKINLHGWGLWTALTAQSSMVENGQRMRVFETWYTPQELSDQLAAGATALPAGTTGSAAARTVTPRRRAALLVLNQFSHVAGSAARTANGAGQVIGFVKYDPTASDHILKQQLLSTAALTTLLRSGAQQIPVFPSTALTLKAAFQVAASGTLVGGRYYRLKAWPGPPATPQAWDPTKWPGCVWIDILGGGSGNGAVDGVASTDGSSRTEATTYPVSSLISYRLSAADAGALDLTQPTLGAKAGDTAILVAMHVAGRETTRWTWQTFWWTPTPDDPHLPSSQAIASLRPAQLSGAARNYAMALGYDMLSPGQPFVGGANSGLAVYVYNPWLEAHFGPADLPDSVAGFDPAGQPAANNTGVASNCMTCHARANYNPDKVAGAPRYSGARYVDLADPQFAGTLQLDFLWSLPGSAQ